jgi:hypothetical protein
MAGNTERKAIVAACMESPFYFTLPLQERLDLMKQLDQPAVFCTLRQDFLMWIKTGVLNPGGDLTSLSPPGPIP